MYTGMHKPQQSLVCDKLCYLCFLLFLPVCVLAFSYLVFCKKLLNNTGFKTDINSYLLKPALSFWLNIFN